MTAEEINARSKETIWEVSQLLEGSDQKMLSDFL
jgi:hypothetical protein